MSALQIVVAFVAIAVVTYVVKLVRRQRRVVVYPHGVSLDRQSIPVPGEPGVFGSPLMAPGEILTCIDNQSDVRTLYDVYALGMQKSGNGDCLGWRESKRGPYVFQSYAKVLLQARQLGAAMRHVGIGAGQTTKIGIYARTCAEWFTMSLGCVTQNMVTVPLYDTLGVEASTHIIKQTGIQLILADNGTKVENLLAHIDGTPTLRHIVVLDFGTVAEEQKERAKSLGVTVVSYNDFMTVGSQHPVDMVLPTPQDLYIVCYTSGTTGLPKGVMLSHANFVSAVATTALISSKFGIPIGPGDAVISYLPLSHVFEQANHWYFIVQGGKIGYFQGDLRLLTHDICELRPVMFPSVPRLLNRLYDKVMAKVEGGNLFTRMLFNLAYARKLRQVKMGIVRNDSIWDRLVFNKIASQLGGRVKLIPTGSAPINDKVLEFCKVTLGCHVIEGYGQTECTALATCTLPGDPNGGHVGAPAPSAHIKLVDVAELDYYASEGKGEVCIRGATVCDGYYEDETKTKETIDEEGWLHTGDVAMWLPNGSLRIVDRKKHIFKLAQGEYVAPEKIENCYTRSPFVAQLYVDGDSLQRFLVSVVVPDEEHAAKWFADRSDGAPKSFADMCADDAFKAAVLEDMLQFGRESKLNSIEQIKAVHLESEPWTVEGGLLTPTQKAKRPSLRKYYQKEIERLYETTKM